MKRFNKWVFSGLLALPSLAAGQSLFSPDSLLRVDVSVDDAGIANYALTYKDRQVIQPSRLAIEGQGASWTSGLKISSVTRDSCDQVWHPVWGQYADVRDHYNEMAVDFVDSHDRVMTVRFRLFDDGLGFRYEFPVQTGVNRWRVMAEKTEFHLSGDPTLYCSPGDYDTDEFLYSTTSLSQLPEAMKQRAGRHSESNRIPVLSVQTPLMIKTDGPDPLYVNIHEAALKGYAAMSLEVDAEKRLLTSHLTPDRNGVAAYVKVPFSTPWRTVIVSDDARDILASQLIYNLNDPCVLDDTSWIKPQKFIGVWWEMFLGRGGSWAYSNDYNAIPGVTDYSKITPSGNHAANNDNVRRYIDFAAAHNIPAVLVEGWNEGWEDWAAYGINRHFSFDKAYPDFDVKALNDYAHAKGVNLIMHHETAGNAADYERQLEDALDFMVDNGYNSVKTGYVGNIIPRSEHHSSQWMVDHFIHVVKRAADHKIMVDSHEAVRPTGLCRTYPNWIAQESARGGEFESMGGNPPEHTCLLPFIRLMGGPMDYTPGLFEPHPSHVTNGGSVEGGSTLAKQLALYLTMPSPLQMACDLPENYERHLDAFKFIEDVPVDWSDSRYLEAEPGDYITVARKDKNSDDWYVGGITDENARTARLDFSFLPEGQKFVATLYADAPEADYRANPKAYKISQREVTSKTRINQKLAPGGGFAMRLTPKAK